MSEPKVPKTRRAAAVRTPLETRYATSDSDNSSLTAPPTAAAVQIGVDEAGRGPLFGRVYAAAVVLPPPDVFDHGMMKDSKKFHSVAKIKEAAAYIKEHAVAWSVRWESEETIDTINIRNATHRAMHAAIRDVLGKLGEAEVEQDVLLVIDGNDFTPFAQPRSSTSGVRLEQLPHVCIEGGDNRFSMIAAASILAKTERDQYIEDLCTAHPQLVERYDLQKNKGYGAKRHMDGIIEHGVTKWHRRSFGVCKTAPIADVE